MSKTVLMPLPDRDFDVTETAVPWRLLTEAGHQVVFLTESGGAAPEADPLLLTGVLFGKLGAEPEPKAFYAEMIASEAYRNPLSWDQVDFTTYDSLLLAGGHAQGMKQYLGSASLQAKVAAFWKTGKPVAAICHGVLVLARTRDPDSGKSVLDGVKTTCLPKYMEGLAYLSTFWKLGNYYRTYPAYVQEEVQAALATGDDFIRGPFNLDARGTRQDDGPAFVVEDGRYVSARWPGDAYLFSKKLLERLAD
jgi:putative intracellular protease/amidase